MATVLNTLEEILRLEQIEENIFRGRSPDEDLQRVFGGQVAGQALVAAGRTVPPDRPVHSLHAYFIRPGDPDVPIVYTVDRIRDGRSFTTRRAVAVQHGRAIFALSASFQVAERGPEYQEAPMPEVPDPETVPVWQDRLKEYRPRVPARWLRPRPVEIRYVGDPPGPPRPTAARCMSRSHPSRRAPAAWRGVSSSVATAASSPRSSRRVSSEFADDGRPLSRTPKRDVNRT